MLAVIVLAMAVMPINCRNLTPIDIAAHEVPPLFLTSCSAE
jgi:hypothetical protein